MAEKKKKTGLLAKLSLRYRNMPKDLQSRKISVKNRAQRLLAATILLPVIIASAIYIIHWANTKGKIETDNDSYRDLYVTATPTAVTTRTASTATASATPAVSPTPEATASPTPLPTESATGSPVPTANEEFEVASDELLVVDSTPNPETLVIGIETPPPIQSSFDNLIARNPETVGYLQIGSQISLPVVHRANDNEFYLNHNFDLEESEAGTLFMDGSNLLVPEDPVLLVYGHNMRNGTMFQPLTCFERPDYIRANPVIYFNTIYEDRKYTPVAVFRASMDPDSDNYLNIRQFSFDETQWELFVLKLEKLSMYRSDIDAKYGDHLLILVTCEYTHENGRLVVVFRQLRPGENEETARAALSGITPK